MSEMVEIFGGPLDGAKIERERIPFGKPILLPVKSEHRGSALAERTTTVYGSQHGREARYKWFKGKLIFELR